MKLLSDMSVQRDYTSSTHKQPKGGEGVRKGGGRRMFSLIEGLHYSVSHCVCTSRRCSYEYNSECVHIQSLYPLQGDTPDPHPPFHALIWNTSSTPGVFSTCQCVCVPVCEWTLSSRRVRRTHFLCQIASYIPHCPSNRPVSTYFFLTNSSSVFLSSSLYGGLCQLSEAQTPDSFWVKHDPQEHNAFSTTTTLFKDRGLARTRFWQWRFPICGPTHRQMDSDALMKAVGRAQTQANWQSTGYNRCLWENLSPM